MPDTPIISNVNGLAIGTAECTVAIPQVSASADSSLTAAAIANDHVVEPPVLQDDGGLQDTPPTVVAYLYTGSN